MTLESDKFRLIPFFHGFPDADLEHLLQFASEAGFEPGDAIFRQGDPGRELYVVTEGNVRFDRTAANGKMRVLSTARFGAVFGELAFLQPQPRTATAIAVEKTSLLIFQKAEIQKLLDLYPSLAAAFYHAVALEIAKRLRESVS